MSQRDRIDDELCGWRFVVANSLVDLHHFAKRVHKLSVSILHQKVDLLARHLLSDHHLQPHQRHNLLAISNDLFHSGPKHIRLPFEHCATNRLLRSTVHVALLCRASYHSSLKFDLQDISLDSIHVKAQPERSAAHTHKQLESDDHQSTHSNHCIALDRQLHDVDSHCAAPRQI